ncbi:unnamed protein product [Cyprideis torosa]|uniref:Caveolin n=1 Tax=Cyprideis torosa TaxID=163714 RepID=A0A7R8WP19_9CRUS|nr:unnamed protein product [Cyprideis torosa]CAG0901283.1 unnamed protein product [Cyprideis torosa]
MGLSSAAEYYPEKIMGEENRDPNELNKHLQIMWDDVIGEPEGIRSVDCGWTCSHEIFKGCKYCTYILLSILLAPFSALCLGLSFACLSFCNIWCCTPCLRVWKINCAIVRRFNEVFCYACCAPCCETCGMFFNHIKIKHKKLPEGEDEDTEILHV